MHDYQRQRVMMLLDPETDPLGAGYHIIQSKLPLAPAVCAVKAGCTARSRSWNFYRNATPTLSLPYWPKSWG
jgi:cell division protein FtsW (lipid II flippase)